MGVTGSGKVVNISISGLSGRTGITIENAKELCKEICLTDALILDNGNDVIARIGGGAVICHKDNIRQTRLTTALHFGYPLGDPRSFGGPFDGFEMAYSTHEVRFAETLQPVSPVVLSPTKEVNSETGSLASIENLKEKA